MLNKEHNLGMRDLRFS